jgi:hypothetical protein
MKQTYVIRQKEVRKLGTNVFAVKSFTHKQLEYTVLLDNEAMHVYCSCPGFKRNVNFACSHILKVIQMDVKGMQVDNKEGMEDELRK